MRLLSVAVGLKVPCALAGAILPGDFKIKPTKMRGEVSNGMLCSGRELGVPDDVDGLMVLPADAPVGQSIREYLALDADDDGLLRWREVRDRAGDIQALANRSVRLEVRDARGLSCQPASAAPLQLQQYSDGHYAVLARTWVCDGTPAQAAAWAFNYAVSINSFDRFSKPQLS